MKSENNEFRLYNALFPIWLLLFMPPLWLIVIPCNFIIDSIVLVIGMYVCKIANKRWHYLHYIFKIFLFGIISDLVGSAYLLLMPLFIISGCRGDELYLTMPALLISAVCIFCANYYETFKKLEKPERKKISLIFAITTAPYTFLIPIGWFAG